MSSLPDGVYTIRNRERGFLSYQAVGVPPFVLPIDYPGSNQTWIIQGGLIRPVAASQFTLGVDHGRLLVWPAPAEWKLEKVEDGHFKVMLKGEGKYLMAAWDSPDAVIGPKADVWRIERAN